jgi:hypothetical protein
MEENYKVKLKFKLGYGLQTTELDFGTNYVHKIQKPIEDRNRTSPFPCKQKFKISLW